MKVLVDTPIWSLAFRKKIMCKFIDIPVVLWDERLSTAGARRTLSGNAREKDVIDEMAAVFILQGYMDREKNNELRKF